MPTTEDIRAHRVARLERLANVGEAFIARLYHFAQSYSVAETARDCGLVASKLIRDIEIATILQLRIEAGWPEREAAAEPRTPGAPPEARPPRPPALRPPELKLPKVPAHFEGEFERDLADAAVIVGHSPDDDSYVRPNFPVLIAKARKSQRAVLAARADAADQARLREGLARRDTS